MPNIEGLDTVSRLLGAKVTNDGRLDTPARRLGAMVSYRRGLDKLSVRFRARLPNAGGFNTVRRLVWTRASNQGPRYTM